jgi:ABC-type multidrug transport system fused ATPase/permease subunit
MVEYQRWSDRVAFLTNLEEVREASLVLGKHIHQGETEAAESICRCLVWQSDELLASVPPGDYLPLAAYFFDLATSLRQLKHDSQAEQAYQAALRLSTSACSGDDADRARRLMAACCGHLGILHQDAGSLEQSARYHGEAVALLECLLKSSPAEKEKLHPCPHCSFATRQTRADGRCVGCGKLLPEELRKPSPPALRGPDPPAMPGFVTTVSERCVLAAEHIDCDYGFGDLRVGALRDVSVELRRGELVALTGTGGSGRSSLLLVLAGLKRPSRGKVLVNDLDLWGLSRREREQFRAKHFGCLFRCEDRRQAAFAVCWLG